MIQQYYYYYFFKCFLSNHRTAGTVDDNVIIIQATGERERKRAWPDWKKRLNVYLERTLSHSLHFVSPPFLVTMGFKTRSPRRVSSLPLSNFSLMLSLLLLFLLLFVLTAPTQHNLDTFVSFTKIAFVCVCVVVDLARLGLNHRNVWGQENWGVSAPDGLEKEEDGKPGVCGCVWTIWKRSVSKFVDFFFNFAFFDDISSYIFHWFFLNEFVFFLKIKGQKI